MVDKLKANADNDFVWSLLQKQYGNNLKISESAFRSYANTLDKEGRRGQASLKEFSNAQQKAMTAGKGFTDGLKRFAKGFTSIAANMAINWAISTAIDAAAKAWNNYANAQENAIERGDKALSQMQESQQKIQSAQNILDSIKSDTITLVDGTEITRFEQLSEGVDSLGRNVSLTSEEFEEYNSLLDQLASVGFDATSSLSNLESQMKAIRRTVNEETLSGLTDWVDSFNAKNNQEVTDFTKEVGYQQQLRALNKVYADPSVNSDKVEEVETLSWWEKLGNFVVQSEAMVQAGQTINETHRQAMSDMASDIASTTAEISSDTQALEKIAKDYSIDIFDEKGNFSYEKYSSDEVQKQFTSVIKSIENSIENEISQSSGFFKAILENSLSYDSLTDDTVSALTGVFSNVDYDTISSYMMDEMGMLDEQMMRDWVNGISEKVASSDVQSALDELFTLDTKKSNLTFTEYKKQANSLINEISSAVPELSKDMLKKTSGFDDSLETLGGAYQKVFDAIGTDVEKLSNEEIEIAARIIGLDEFEGDYNDLMDKVYLAKSAIDLDATPLKDAIDDAFESENAGDNYKDMVSKLETAKELYDKGEIGTDDFKSVAAWLSPTGADDAMNFQENWGKAERYFTEDATGITNFLKDLESKGLAKSTSAIDANGNAIQQWTYNIEDLEDAAQRLGIGFEPMMAMFGRLEDFGFSNNFVGSVEDGAHRIAEKSAELARAEAELAELTKPGQYETDAGMTFGNQTAIDALRAKIAQLKQDIGDTTTAMELLVSKSSEDRIAETEGAKAAMQTLYEEQQKILNDSSLDSDTKESIAAQIQDQIDAWGQEYHIELDGDVTVDETELESESIVAPVEVEMSISNEEDIENLSSYLSNLSDTYNPTIIATIENDEQIDNVVSQLSKIPPDTPANLSFNVQNQEQADALSEKIDKFKSENGSTFTYTVDVVDSTGETDSTETVKYDVDSTEVDAFKAQNHNVDADVIWGNDTTNVKTNFIATGTVRWSNYLGGSGSISPANGTAHSRGTAYYYGNAYSEGTAMWQHYRNASRKAYAGGHWGLHHDANGSLINELGSEIIVRNGEWFVMNDGYPTLANLQRGDIIFNHEQSKSILEKGYVTGSHAKLAYSNGTVNARSFGKAFNGAGSGGGTIGVGGSGSKAYSSSNSASTKSTDKNTAATKENTKAQVESVDWMERLVDATKREADALEKAIESFEMHENQNKAIDAYVKKSQEYMQDLRSAQNVYASKANTVQLSDSYKKKVRNGSLVIEDITDEDLKEKIELYQKWYDKSKELGEQIEEINQSIRETQLEKLDNIKDDYSNIVDYAESLSDYYQTISDLSEDVNLVGDETALLSVLKQQVVIRQALVNEQQELTDQLNALVKAGYIAEYTDTWHEWKTEINNVQQSILECDSALNELRQSIREVRLEDFYNSLDELDFASDMASSIRDLMSEEGIYDDSVKITSSGIAQLGLMGTELVSAKQKVANYNTAIDALNKDLENGDITQAQYNEQLREYQKDQMDAISATKDAKDAILDLVKNGIEKQTEAMDKLISKRKEDLDKQKEYYDFQKEMSDKSSEMRKIQAQIQALSGDDSLSANQRRRSLQSQLKELQDEYAQSQKDREYDLIQDAYDETLERFKENQDATILELETSLDAQNNAIANALAVAKENYTTVYAELGTLASDYNFTLTDSIVTPWTDAISAIEQYESAIGKLSGNVEIDTSPITSSAPTKNETVPTTNEASKQNTSKNANGTWIKQSGKWWYEHDDGSYTTNNWEQIDGKWYKFDEQGWMQTGWQPWGTDSTGQTAWYYMDPDGSMAKNKWVGNYYVGSDGVMLRNTTTPDGYQVDASGLWTGAKNSNSSGSSSKAKVSATTKTLQYGMTDSQVGTLQTALKSLGYYKGNIDNSFGDQTLSALKRFQTDAKNRGEYTGQVDGICGSLTRSAFKLRGYASGTLNAAKGWAFVDDTEDGKLALGSELIVGNDGTLITPYGAIREFSGGEIVMNADQTKRFVELLNGGYNYPQLEKPKLPQVKVENRGGDTIYNNYDALFKNIGDVTRETFPGVQKMCEKAFEYTNMQYKEKRKR